MNLKQDQRDASQVDTVPGLPPTGGYENIVTARDVFSRYFSAYPTASQNSNTNARVIIKIMANHAYLSDNDYIG